MTSKKLKSGTVYAITNTTNGKVYVGATTKPLIKRWNEHCRDWHSNPLHVAMRANLQAFTHYTIESNVSPQNIDATEKIWIFLMNALHPNGYNLTTGGKVGFKVCAAMRKARGRVTKRKWTDPAYRKKITTAIKTSHAKPAVRLKMSASQKRRATTPEGIAERSANLRKRWTDPTYRKKMLKCLKQASLKRWGYV